MNAERAQAMVAQAELDCQKIFAQIEETELYNTRKVLRAFRPAFYPYHRIWL